MDVWLVSHGQVNAGLSQPVLCLEDVLLQQEVPVPDSDHVEVVLLLARSDMHPDHGAGQAIVRERPGDPVPKHVNLWKEINEKASIF